jgi:hypothetical protein
MTTVGSLGVAFVILILILASQRFLLPGIIILGSFILFVLWLTGLIETSLQLYGSEANVNVNCQNFVTNMPFSGNTIEALAWLTQNNICAFLFLFLSFFFAIAVLGRIVLTVPPRQLLESRVCVRDRQYHILLLDDGDVLESPSGCAMIVLLYFYGTWDCE